MITYECPLDCYFCCADEGPEAERKEVEPESLMPQFNQLVEQGLNALCLTGGEPFAKFERSMKAIKIFKDLGVPERRIFTCGYLCTPENIKEAVETGVTRFHLSVDGLKEEHDSIRGRGSFDKAISAIETMSELGIFVKVVSVLSAKTVHQIPALMDLLLPMVGQLQFREPNLIDYRGRNLKKDVRMRDYATDYIHPKVQFTESGNYRAVCDRLSMRPDGTFTRCGQTKIVRPLEYFQRGLRDECKLRDPITKLNGAKMPAVAIGV
jgi:MoaA/NifB/PqqE/SkfB family radical SAM enzyme